MAKIRKQTVRYTVNKIQSAIEIDIYYSSSDGFYIPIPEKFKAAFDTKTNEQKKDLYLTVIKPRGVYSDEDPKAKKAVTGITEDAVVTNARSAFATLAMISIKEEAVIIIFMDITIAENRDSFWYDEKYNNQHQQIEGSLALAYASKVSAGDNTQPSYYLNGRNESRRHSINIDRASIIIPDTPTNRAAIEKLYNALNELFKQLEKYGASEKTIMQLIANTNKNFKPFLLP